MIVSADGTLVALFRGVAWQCTSAAEGVSAMKNTIRKSDRNRVLIVNDEMGELSSLIDGMEREGFRVAGTIDAYAALEMLSDADYDAVLVDLMLPNMNGLKLARRIKQKFPRVLTLLMSDYLLSPAQLAKAETGAVGFVPKPCRCEEIASFLLNKLFEKSSREETNSSASDTVNSTVPFEMLSAKCSI